MMKKSVAMLAVCMLAQSHLAIAAGTPAPQEINIVLLGTKGGPSLLNTARLPQATALTIGDKIWLIDAGYGASLQLVKTAFHCATSILFCSPICTATTYWIILPC